MSERGSASARWLPLVPDLLTTLFFLVVWVRPLTFGQFAVKTAMLTMLLEFFLVHATGFFTVLANDRDGSRWKRTGALLGLSLFYVMMIGAFAYSFRVWWPLLAFGWLVAGKVAWVWSSARGRFRHPASRDTSPSLDVDTDDATMRQMMAWAGSVVLFLGGVMATSIMDVPRWGMTRELQPGFGLDMSSSGIWESEPHRVVAFGALYFGVMFLAKTALVLRDSRRARLDA